MGKETGIAWTHSTFNPWWGCTKVDACCSNCYAETLATRWGFAWGPKAPRRFFGPKHWAEPLAWNAKAAKSVQPMRVFCGSMCDWAEDRRDLDDERAKLWKLIETTPALTWMLLTKRAENIRAMLPVIEIGSAVEPRFNNVWVGVTVGMRANLGRIDVLREVPAVVRFLSVEPLIEELGTLDLRGIQLVIVGGESGPKARPFHVEWARDLRDQCKAAGVAFFMKQMGANAISDSDDDRRHCGDMNLPKNFQLVLRDRAGADPSEWPEDLRIQQMPKEPT
jgi:protein gp37